MWYMQLDNLKCVVCGGQIYSGRAYAKYCGDKCRNFKLSKTTSKAKIRFEVLRRDGFRCIYCGLGAKDGAILEVDHVTPKSRGGSNLLSNFATSCSQCNEGKSNTILSPEELKNLINR